MIGVSYIREGQTANTIPVEAIDFFTFIKESTKEFDDIYYSHKVDQDLLDFDSELFGESTDEYDVFTENALTDAITKLGEFIKEMFGKLIDLIRKIIDKVKNIGFRFKSDDKKLDELLKRHPELKDKEICKFDEIRFSDMKSIEDLDKAYERCMMMLERGDNPDTISGKWKKALSDFKNDKGPIHTGLKVITAASATVALAAAIKKFTNDGHDQRLERNRQKATLLCRRFKEEEKVIQNEVNNRPEVQRHRARNHGGTNIDLTNKVDEWSAARHMGLTTRIRLGHEIYKEKCEAEGRRTIANSRVIEGLVNSIHEFCVRHDVGRVTRDDIHNITKYAEPRNNNRNRR